MGKDQDLILGAGGVLWQNEPFRSDIAVIHRRRHGMEWCLPKGKQNPEDKGSLEKTAVREMKEETGCTAKIVGFVGMTEYAVGGSKKQVFYWHMRLVGKCHFEPTEEVDQLMWLPPAEAIKILTHSEQKEIIKNALVTVPRSKKSVSPRSPGSAKYHRLAGSIMAYKAEIANRCDNNLNPLEKATELLRMAEVASHQGDLDEAWRLFHAAQRMEIFSLSGEELRSKAETIANEAEKLTSWRRGALEGLLGKAGSLKDTLTREQTYQAAVIRDEHYNNTAYKDRLLKDHIAVLAGLITGLVTLIGIDVLANTVFGFEPGRAVGVALYGLLGGAYSAVLKVPTSTVSSRIPELNHSLQLTLLRILVGAVSALIVYQILQSDFLKSMFTVLITRDQSYYVIAFVSGFSERLVLKAVSIVGKE